MGDFVDQSKFDTVNVIIFVFDFFLNIKFKFVH